MKLSAPSWASCLGLLLIAAVPVSAAEVVVELIPAGVDRQTEGDRVQAISVEVRAEAGDRQVTEAAEVVLPGEITLDLADETFWALEVLSPGMWSARTAVSLAQGQQRVRIALWPTVELRGRCCRDARAESPAKVEVQFRPTSEQREHVPSGTVGCAVTEGSFSCQIPVGRFDLAVRAPGFASHFLFGTELQADVDLGVLAWAPGASLVGRVEAEGEGPTSGARAHLAPATADPTGESTPVIQRLERSLGPRGLVQFEGLPPGQYSLWVEDTGYAPGRRIAVTLRRGEELELEEPLRLQRPRQVRLHLDPARDPWGELWRIELEKAEGNLEVLERLQASETGVMQTSLGPGRYGVMIQTGAGDPWHGEALEVFDVEVERWISLPVTRVRGTVRLGDEPLSAARLLFEQRGGAGSVLFETDEDGVYRGLLPKAGQWSVEVGSQEPVVERHFRKILVPKLDGHKVATLDFELPDTRIVGEVVDAMGNPMERAIVAVSVPEGDETGIRHFVEDSEGRFELYGLPEGMSYLRAESGERMSRRLPLELEDGVESPFVSLVVEDRKKVSGLVVDEGGVGIGGARVTVRGLGQLGFWVSTEHTAPDGTFEAMLPPEETEALIAVQAVGHALHASRAVLPMTADERLVLPLARRGGTLEVEFSVEPSDGSAGLDPYTDLFLLHGGAFVGLRSLLTWAHFTTGNLPDAKAPSIPQLESGAYHLCRLDPAELQRAVLEGPPEKSCRSGFLSEAGRLELVPPAPPASEPRAGDESIDTRR
ncbi:MAG: carboxypeptidase-like regulatory domain-containing protein [Acidobacteriota bacterium]